MRRLPEEEETDAGPADYALWSDNQIVGIVEAKKLTVGPQSVLMQAERYAKGLRKSKHNYGGLRCPFRYATNGEVTNRKRKLLVAMATGTGKTFTMVNQVYRLMKSGVARRVLFLVDRRALAAQAVRAFASFEAEPGPSFPRHSVVDWFPRRPNSPRLRGGTSNRRTPCWSAEGPPQHYEWTTMKEGSPLQMIPHP